MVISLVDSKICRLCSQEYSNGKCLFSEDGNFLLQQCNKYLPIKLIDDGRYPVCVCEECETQVQKIAIYLDRLIAAQKKLGQLLNGKALLSTGIEPIYSEDHQIRSQTTKKRPGRKKRCIDAESHELQILLGIDRETEEPRQKRERKLPKRFQDAVNGKELENILRVTNETANAESENVNEPGESTDDPLQCLLSFCTDDESVVADTTEPVSKSDPSFPVAKSRRGRKPTKKYVCNICGSKFKHEGRLIIHRRTHGTVLYQCSACHLRYASREDLNAHHQETGHQGEGIVDGDPSEIRDEQIMDTSLRFPCQYCEGKTFSSRQALGTHIRGIHEKQRPYECYICHKTFSYKNSIKAHMAGVHSDGENARFRCETCCRVFRMHSSLVYHRETKHNNSSRKFVCPECGKGFKHKQLLARHSVVHRPERPFKCSLCPATFKTRANLYNHNFTHSGLREYYCEMCGNVYQHKTALELHIRSHTGEKPFGCQYCGKRFAQKGNLSEHERTHTGEKPYVCSECGNRFTTSTQCKVHMKRHFGVRPWKCEYCPKSFIQKENYRTHIRRHRNERPFQCMYCQKAFGEKWALRKHERLHTGEKPYACNICGKRYADCSNLTKHKKSHRDKVLNDNEPVLTYLSPALENKHDSLTTSQIIYVTVQDGTLPSDGLTGLEDATVADDSLQLVGADPDMQLVQDGTQVQLTTEDGQSIPFVVTTEDGQTLQLADDQTQLQSLAGMDEGVKPVDPSSVDLVYIVSADTE